MASSYPYRCDTQLIPVLRFIRLMSPSQEMSIRQLSAGVWIDLSHDGIPIYYTYSAPIPNSTMLLGQCIQTYT